jgi:hypothetical protein
MFVHSSKNLKNHEKISQKTSRQEDVRQRNGGHEEGKDVYYEVWWQDEKAMLNKKHPLVKCYQAGGKLNKKEQAPPRKDDIRNPENKEYVNETANDLGVKKRKVTQRQFNERYSETLDSSYAASLPYLKKKK